MGVLLEMLAQTAPRRDLEAIAKGFAPHVRAEWERQQRVIRAAVAWCNSRPFADDDLAQLEELRAAVRALR